MSQNATDMTCLCSIGIPTTVVSVVCGTISNVIILIVLFKSNMARETTGKVMVNEAVADALLNVFTGVMLWTTNLERGIQLFGLPVVMALSGVKAFSIAGLSITLCVAICRPLLYGIYVLPSRVHVFIASTWLPIPVLVGFAYLDGTFYERNKVSGCVEPNYTYQNWWIGAGNVISVLVVPLTLILVCACKIIQNQAETVLESHTSSMGSKGKIRLAKLMVVLFMLNMLSKIPFHVIVGLHVQSKPLLGAVSLLYFMYSTAKLFLYFRTLCNFRRSALRLFCSCRTAKNPGKLSQRRTTSGTT